MYHAIQFTEDFTGDLEISRKHPLERLLIKTGTRLRAQMRPYITEGEDGPVEVADLYFEDGSTMRAVPFARFSFLS
jgi:hypothetical protein